MSRDVSAITPAIGATGSWQTDALMRRTLLASSCAAVAALALSTGCPGSSSTSSAKKGTGPAQPKGELDKLMRTRMNTSYSQLVFLVFHAEGEPNFTAISEESARLSEAVQGVLKLQVPPVAQSEQARQVYVDYNEMLRKDNDRFVEATGRKDMTAMSAALTKVGETCSACHNFFRVKIPDQAE
jgi:cytochrome c556